MAGLAPVTGGTGGHIDPTVAEEPDQYLALIAGQGDGQDVGRCSAAHPYYAGDGAGQPFYGVVFQLCHVGQVAVQGGAAQLGGGGEGGQLPGGLGAGAHPAFLAAPQNEGGQTQTLSNI